MFSSNASAVSGDVNYIEDVFSTYLYTGNGATQTIINNIDLATEGGMTWIKTRSGAGYNLLFDTVRGATKFVASDLTSAQGTDASSLTAFTSSGFSVGSTSDVNQNGIDIASWSFREQAKFFDVVTYTGNGANRTIAHLLGSVPGCILVKRTDTTGAWQVYHRNLANTEYMVLNTTAAKATGATRWNSTTPTATEFSLGTDATVNASGGTYVAYLFAHDAGGFGLTGTDNVISCGSFTDTSGAINLGYEPQYILYKCSSGAGAWTVIDTMRGLPGTGATTQQLYPNTSGGEAGGYSPYITSTGFYVQGVTAGTYIYIAIRRGPMKVPTSGTTVFTPVTRTGTGADVTVTGAGFPPDFLFNIDRFGTGPAARYNYDRLRGVGQTDLRTNSAAAEGSAGAIGVSSFNMTGFSIPSTGISFLNSSSASYINYFFGRAPSFFDEVCYTTAAGTQSHNLGVSPELVITKTRGTSDNWYVFTAQNGYGKLNLTDAWIGTGSGSGLGVNLANVTSTTISKFDFLGTGLTALSYMFATCPGVSKVGSYTGTATTQQINCGFTAGSRFVMIKRTDSTGDWYVWDSARGIVAGNDPYLFFNDTAAEVTSTDYVDTYAAGFELTSTAPAALNASGGTYIFLAIA